uniref:AWS domain-containing protein n=1 Tax=Panagrellus redivivus TaxID=6233 RepID=A0A7E4W1T3_PANRE
MASTVLANPANSMNLELVPIMWKGRTTAGEAQCMGVIIRSGTSTDTTMTTAAMPSATISSLPPVRGPPKLLPRGMPRILPAPRPVTTSVTTMAGTSSTTLSSNTTQVPKKPPSKAKPRSRSRKKVEPKPTPATSPPTVGKVASAEVKPASINDPQPSTSYEQQPTMSHSYSVPPPNLPIASQPQPQSVPMQTNNNGLGDEDLNAIEIAHSIRNDHELNRNYWQPPGEQGANQQSASLQPVSSYYHGEPSGSDQYMYHQQAGPSGYNAQYNGHQMYQPVYHGNASNSQNGTVSTSNANGVGYYLHPQGHLHPQHQQQWRPQVNGQQQYAAPNNQNQMTSSTPDSGIQSIDGSPPSTSAFTPPMVSPYPLQSSHFDASQMNGFHGMPPPMSHVQLPPLNCMVSQISSSVPSSMPPPPAPLLQTSATSSTDRSYLDQQQPSCSYTSPPVLDTKTGEDDSFDNDSDCDYSDMPTLFPADSAKAVPAAVPSTPNSIEPEPMDTSMSSSVPGPSDSRSASRISSFTSSEHRSVSVANDELREQKSADEIAIKTTMNAEQIAEVLKSSLGLEKMQELLRRIQPTEKQPSPSPSPAPPSLPSKPARTRTAKRKVTPPPQLAPITKVKPVKAPPASKPPRLAKQEKTSYKPAPKLKKVAKRVPKTNSKAKRTILAAIAEPNASTSTKGLRATIARSLFSRGYRHREPIRHREKKVEVVSSESRIPGTINRPWKPMTLCTEDPEIERLFMDRPSQMLIPRHEENFDVLADAIAGTQLHIPKVETIRYEPSGSWKSAIPKQSSSVPSNRRRKSSTIAKATSSSKSVPAVPTPVKQAKKSSTVSAPVLQAKKLGPLRISISSRSTPSTSSEISGPTKGKRGKQNPVTPVPKDEYVKIRSLVQTDILPKRSLPSKECHCTNDSRCATDACITRANYAECSNYSCHLYNSCQNRRLMNNVVIHQLQTFKEPPLNFQRVRSTIDIYAGQLICEFVGETLRKETYQRRLESGESFPRYAVELIPNAYVVDASRKGNLSRFMNHSCSPTCTMSRWMVNGIPRIGIFAISDISRGVELTYDYGMHVYSEERVECLCGSDSCKGFLPCMPPPQKAPTKPPKLSEAEQAVVRRNPCFLRRNLRKYTPERPVEQMQPLPESSPMHALSKVVATIVNKLIKSMTQHRLPRRFITYIRSTAIQVFKTAEIQGDSVAFVQRFDSSIMKAINMISKSLERKDVDPLKQAYLSSKHQSKVFDVSGNLHLKAIGAFMDEKSLQQHSSKLQNSPKIPEVVDLSYMETGVPIGSYDPDKEAMMQAVASNKDGDCIRCVCGIIDDAGMMYQCDRCHFWLHKECLNLKSEPKEYICDFCVKGYTSTPLLDILLDKQPSVVIESCVYYKTMVNHRGIQARVNECVYVEKNINDEYKSLLSKFNHDWVSNPKAKKKRLETPLPPPVEAFDESKINHEAQKLFKRTEVRVFRIDRLIRVPTGERFAFGFYYARPHEAFIDPTRTFYRNELLATPLFDTLPIDTIVGRCLVLEPAEFAAGRPRGPKYREEDVYICEYSVDRSAKVFDKITGKNRYPLNMCSYTFDNFKTPLVLQRTLNPFNPNQEVLKTSPKHTKRRNAAIHREVCDIILDKTIKKIKQINNIVDP